jgi:MFS superfamily sulfate permease-like transporter
LLLIEKGIRLVADTQVWLGWDSMLVGLAGFAFVLTLTRSERIPTALVLFGVGLILAWLTHPTVGEQLKWGLYLPQWTHISADDFRAGFWRAAVPQIPLTTLNSVIAVCALSVDLFPDRPAHPRSVAVSVGLMNLISCWFGAMPMCHGAGGLAGQYRFGARTNASILFLGAAKLFLAVFLGGSLLMLLRVYPNSILGVLLGISGLELAVVARDQTQREAAIIMLATAGCTLAFENTALGFALGWGLATLLQFTQPSKHSNL